MNAQTGFLVLPAIDLLGGRVVRLHQGDYAAVTTYDEDPVRLATRLQTAGATRLHVVDLDAARGRGASNRRVLADIRRSCAMEIQTGGGIRSPQDCLELLEAGIDWLIVGTALIRDPDAVAAWVARWPGRFLAGIDARGGLVRVQGWEEGGGMSALEAAERAYSLGCSGIVHTDIGRDGTLAGPNLAETTALAATIPLPVILSGGVASHQDLTAAREAGLAGAITGKALFDGRLDWSRLWPGET